MGGGYESDRMLGLGLGGLGLGGLGLGGLGLGGLGLGGLGLGLVLVVLVLVVLAFVVWAFEKTYMSSNLDTLGTEPRASRMLSGCDTTTPFARLHEHLNSCTLDNTNQS